MQNHACSEGFLGMAGNMVPILPPWFSLPPPVHGTYTLKIYMCNMHVEPHPQAPNFIPPFHVELHSVVDPEWFLFVSGSESYFSVGFVDPFGSSWILHIFFLIFLNTKFFLCITVFKVFWVAYYDEIYHKLFRELFFKWNFFFFDVTTYSLIRLNLIDNTILSHLCKTS